MRSALLESYFPGLRTSVYDITSRETEDYNCIAHAAGVDTDKWWPHPDYYWPPGRPINDDSVDNFADTFCEVFGYESCVDGEFETGYVKIAIYAQGDRTKHMARQIGPDRWTSKLGDERDIVHALQDLEGQHYGSIVRFLRRPIA
jgi:hypothetical protein